MKERSHAAFAAAALSCALAVAPGLVRAVGLSRSSGKFTVTNAHYSATFDPAHGGALTHMAYPGVSRFAVSGRFTCGYDTQLEKYEKRAHGAVRTIDQHSRSAKAEVVQETADLVVLRFTWKLDGDDSAVQTVSCDDSALVRFEQKLSFSRPIGPAAYRMFSIDADSSKAVFLPENRGFTGVQVDGQRSRFPRWKYLTDGQVSFGLVACGDGWDCFNFFARAKTGDWGEMGQIELRRLPLFNEKCPGEATLKFALLATRWKMVAFDAAQSVLASNPPVQLCDIEPDRVLCRVGGENGLRTTLVNNTKATRKVTVKAELAHGLGGSRVVREESILLGPHEMREWRAKWKNDPSVEWGVASRVTVVGEDDMVLDRRADVTGVTDCTPAAAMFYILNPGFCNQAGAEAAWADKLRRNYIGVYEYYVWTPSVWDPTRKAGLSPVADEWDPVTESTAGYRVTIKKKFLKDLVNASHDRGISVYAWITGLTNYRMAYAYPDMFQYCRNGQLSIYSGKVHGTERFAVAKLAPYTVEAARDWGDQMADSVDMFGWDGCRWDWSFLPCSPNDPLYQPLVLTAPEKLEWFNSKGESCYKLYPDQNHLAAKLHDAWVAAVTNRHPKFVTTWNMNASRGIFERNPDYMDTLTRDGLGLFEYLLNIVTKYPTYAAWSEELTADTQRARRNGCQSAVGHMSGKVNEGTVGERLAKMACVFSGSKWWGGPMEYRYWGAERRSFAFAVRFGEFMYSPEFRRLPKERRASEVKVDSGGRAVHWEPWVFERVRGRTRDVVVNILNTDGSEYIVRKQPAIVPVDRLLVTVAPRPGERLVSAHALLPGDEPLAVALDCRSGKVAMPRFEEGASLVCTFASEGGAK